MFHYQMSIIKHFKPQMRTFLFDKQHLGLQIQRLLHKCTQTQQQHPKCSAEVSPHHPNSHHWWLPWKVLTYLSKTTYQRSKNVLNSKIQGGGDSLSLCMRKERLQASGKTSGIFGLQSCKTFWSHSKNVIWWQTGTSTVDVFSLKLHMTLARILSGTLCQYLAM